MSKQQSFFIISILLIALLNDTILFGMLGGVYVKKQKLTALHTLLNNPLIQYKKFAATGSFSILPKEFYYEIFAQLNPVDKNCMQQTSHYWNNVGSKRVPNVYKLALCISFNASLDDFRFVFLCATYDKKQDVIDSLKQTIKNDCKFNWRTMKDGKMVERSFDCRPLSESSSQKDCPSELERACFFGDVNKMRKLLFDCDLHTYIDKNLKNDLISTFALAVRKNDIKCLSLLTSLSQSNDKLLTSYAFLFEIALKTDNQKAFEFLSCNFPMKPIEIFLVPFLSYVEFKEVLLLGNKEKVLDHLGCDKKKCESEQDYYQLISFLTSTGVHRMDSLSRVSWTSLVVDYFNKMRKEKKWNSSAEIFANQDKDLNVAIKKPLLDALGNNDLDCLKELIKQLEENQFFFDRKQRSGERNSLFSIHIELLKKSRQLNNEKAFFLLSCLRLTLTSDDIRDKYMISPYEQYSNQVDYQKELMAKQQSSSMVDYFYVTANDICDSTFSYLKT